MVKDGYLMSGNRKLESYYAVLMVDLGGTNQLHSFLNFLILFPGYTSNFWKNQCLAFVAAHESEDDANRERLMLLFCLGILTPS